MAVTNKVKCEMNEKCQLWLYIYHRFAPVALYFLLSAVYSVEDFSQSHAFLLSFGMHCPIRGVFDLSPRRTPEFFSS